MILFISCCKTLKTDPSGEGDICTCATWIGPFLTNVHPHDWFMLATAQPENAITIGNWGFIWKYKIYARKCQNNAIRNQIILKTLTRGE